MTVVDAGSSAGGRVQTDVVEGFRLDRGFQVYLTGYPTCKLELDEDALNLRKFEPGCLVWDGAKMHEVHKDSLLQMMFDRWLPNSDLVKLFALSMETKGKSAAEIWGGEDMPITEFMSQKGISDRTVNHFVRPFFGGVMLDTSLAGSVLPFLYYWKMFDEGDTAVPAMGMGAVTQQLLEGANDCKFKLGEKVESLVRKDGYVTGVKLAGGKSIKADAVVVATDARSAAELTGQAGPTDFRACTTVHFAASISPVSDKILVVNGSGTGIVHHVAPMSKVAPELAPKGRHLVSATLLSNPGHDDLTLAKSVQYELRSWFPKAGVEGWVPLAVHRIPLGQMAQPVGFRDHLLPANPETGLYVAGEGTTYAGLDGAIQSGHDAVAGVMSWFKGPVAV